MKTFSFLLFALFVTLLSKGQTDQTKYPEPEFSNEVYLLKKDSSKVIRLEKGASKMDTKTKMGGMAGMENGYSLDGEKSTARFTSGNNLSFVFSTGTSTEKKSSPQTDSMMRANGIDPAMMSLGSMMDPSQMIVLYKMDPDKGNRKIYLMKTGGALPFASHKNKSSDKYSLSVKKIREGYWELIVDKNLPKGEYAFTVSGMGMANMDGSVSIFAFAID